MTQGDPKKVALLSVVAVGACGFLAYSLLGLGGGASSPKAGNSAAEEAPNRDQAVGFRLASDPFNHPELIRKKRDAQAASKTLAMGSPTPTPPEGSGAKPWVMPEPLSGPLKVDPDIVPEGPAGPAENAGNTRPKIEESRIVVRLSAVVHVEKAVALISVVGKESRAYAEGDRLASGWKVLAIEESGVILVGKKDVVRLVVGQEATL